MTIRVLVADDQELVRTGLSMILDAQPGIDVVGQAADGRQAVSKARELRPDVCLFDIRMPELDGIEATRRLAGPDVADPLAVVVITTFDLDEYVHGALKAGARGFLLKSDAKQFLISAVESLAAHKPFFTGKVSETLLETYLAKGSAGKSALSSREKAVVQLIAEGKTNKQIADILSISTKTVETHRALALRKLNLDTTAALIRYAIRNGLVEA